MAKTSAWKKRMWLPAYVVGDGQCPSWVISGYRDRSARSLLHPYKQTLALVTSMSAKCQKATFGCAGVESAKHINFAGCASSRPKSKPPYPDANDKRTYQGKAHHYRDECQGVFFLMHQYAREELGLSV
jgi:hypothetical protein